MEIDSDLCDKIHALEMRLLAPEFRRSIKILDRLLADEFLEIGSLGRVYRKQDILDQLPTEDELRFSIDDFLVLGLSEEVVLATYRAARTRIESVTPEHSLRSSIWRHEGGRWRLVFHQGTPMDPRLVQG